MKRRRGVPYKEANDKVVSRPLMNMSLSGDHSPPTSWRWSWDDKQHANWSEVRPKGLPRRPIGHANPGMVALIAFHDLFGFFRCSILTTNSARLLTVISDRWVGLSPHLSPWPFTAGRRLPSGHGRMGHIAPAGWFRSLTRSDRVKIWYR
jgi:hypothetical protein